MTTFLVVAGTGTGIGKTFVTAGLATALDRRGVLVAARKPVQSFAPDDASPTDADVLAAATGVEPHTVCPLHRWLPLPMAPPMAAEALDLEPFTVAELVAEVRAGLPAGAVVLVESAGGVRSPLATNGDTVTLADALRPAIVLLVADATLGTINAVRLSADALAGHRMVVYLNRYDGADDLHARNREWLVTRAGLEVVTDPETLERVVETVLATSG